MTPLLQEIPPGRVWVEVVDLPSALMALELLTEHAKQSNTEFLSCDSDTL